MGSGNGRSHGIDRALFLTTQHSRLRTQHSAAVWSGREDLVSRSRLCLPFRPASSLPGCHGLFLPIRSALAGFKSSRLSIGIATLWSGREDLNLRHPAPKAGALPGCATPRHWNDNLLHLAPILLTRQVLLRCEPYTSDASRQPRGGLPTGSYNTAGASVRSCVQ